MLKSVHRFALMGALSCVVSFATDMDQTIYGFQIKSYQAADLTENLRQEATNLLLDFHDSYYIPGTLNNMDVVQYREFNKGRMGFLFQSINAGKGTFFAMTEKETGMLQGTGVYHFDPDYTDVIRLSPIALALPQESHASLMPKMGDAFFAAFPNIKRILVKDRPNALNKQGLIASAGFKASDYKNEAWSEGGKYHFYEYTRSVASE